MYKVTHYKLLILQLDIYFIFHYVFESLSMIMLSKHGELFLSDNVCSITRDKA